MITFDQVSIEFRSLVERRRKHLTFLFSTAAAYSILADGLLHGKLPRPLAQESATILIAGVMTLMLLSLVTALREARLHKGLVCNGHLWKSLNESVGIEIYAGRNRPWRFNPFGVSTSLFAIALLSGLGLLALTFAILGVGVIVTVIVVCLLATLLVWYFIAQHRAGLALAAARRAQYGLAQGNLEAWRIHISASIDDAHRDMLELLAMAGLVTFFGFQLLAGLGDVRIASVGALQFKEIELASAAWLAIYMTIVTGIALVCYVRLRLAVGYFSILLDPTDRAFNVWSFDDAFFGLTILLAPISFDVFLLVSATMPYMPGKARGGVTGAVILVILVVERLLMAANGKRLQDSAGD